MTLRNLLLEVEKLNQEELERVIAAAQKRLAYLNQPKGELQLTLVNGVYVLRLRGTSKGIKLGEPLSAAAALRQANNPAPTPADFELPKAHALQQMNRTPNSIGWWEPNDQPGPAHRRYYLVEPYDEARAAWHEKHKLASDPLALVYHLPLDAVKRIRDLEQEGYTIVLPE
jgi:hypothetical protein